MVTNKAQGGARHLTETAAPVAPPKRKKHKGGVRKGSKLFSLSNTDPAKLARMQEYLLMRKKIFGWCKILRTCSPEELGNILVESREIRRRLEECESAVLLIFKQSFCEIEEVAAARLGRGKGNRCQP